MKSFTTTVLAVALLFVAGAALADDTTGADTLLLQAREAAGEDHHKDAITLYKRAIAARPALRGDVAVELGHQFAWSQEPDSAMHWFDIYLASHPRDLEAELGIALALGWSGRYEESIARYQAILERQPDAIEARLNLAAVNEWDGRMEDAERMYVSVLDRDPENGDAREGLARVRAQRTPNARYEYTSTSDSDDIDRRFHSVEVELSPAARWRVLAGYANGSITQPNLPDVERDVFGLTFRRQFNKKVAATFAPAVERNTFDPDASITFGNDDFTLFTFDGYVTVRPNNAVRLDFGWYRGSFENPETIYRNIHLDEASAGADIRLGATLTSSSSVRFAGFSDGNHRLTMSHTLGWRPMGSIPLPPRTELIAGTTVGFIDFSDVLDNGYYNPNDYVTIHETMEMETTLTSRLIARLEGRFGVDRESGGDWFTVGSIGGSVTVRLTYTAGLTAGFHNSRSRLETQSGYQADGFYLSLDLSFPPGD